jgi:ribosomal protein L37AE/L43A
MNGRKWSDQDLARALPLCTTWASLCRKLGLEANSSRTNDVLKRKIKELKLDCSHFSWRRKFDKEQLIELVPKVKSFRQLLLKLNLSYVGQSYPCIKKAIKECGLDTSHFDGGKSLQQGIVRKRTDLKTILVENGSIGSARLKKILYRENLKKPICEICGLEKWLGEPIPTELDHINGISNDNRIKNLRIICRNCEGLLPTFCRGQNRNKQHALIENGKEKTNKRRRSSRILSPRIKKEFLCIKCGTNLKKRTKWNLCRKCFNISERRVIRPTKEELSSLIEKIPMTKIAKQFGVSNTAVKKWAKNYGIIIENKLGYWTKVRYKKEDSVSS